MPAQEGIAAAIAHNISPAVFLKHYRSIRDAETEHRSTGSAVQTAKKAAKSDGVNLDALRLLTKLNKLDSDEAELQLKHMITYAGWAGLPLGSQLDMFGKNTTDVPEAEAEKQREFNSAEEGQRAGAAGQPRDSNPNADAGSPEFVAWDKAWLKADRKFQKQTQATAEQMGRNAGVTPSGRRRRNGTAATAH